MRRRDRSGTLDIVIFGTYQELVKSLSAWTERQWDNVWPRTAEIRFDWQTLWYGFAGGAMAVAITPWTSTGLVKMEWFDRPGRATIVLARQPDGRGLAFIRTCRWLAVYRRIVMENAR